MPYIERSIEKKLLSSMGRNKAILVYGPRQSGKTTVLHHLFDSRKKETLWLDADMQDVRMLFENPSPEKFRSMLSGRKILVIDEAQRVENIGLAIKIMVDNLPDIDVIATGSSSFELRNRTGEALTGRKTEFYLTPLSYSELARNSSSMSEKRYLEDRLIYGSYPRIVADVSRRQVELSSLASSYLYKDILAISGLQKPGMLEKLVRAIAFQIGSEVSFQELADIAGIDRKTAEKYIDILERCFVVFRLHAFSRNLRNEIRKSVKIYFWDNGIRNAVIGNVLPLVSRSPSEVGKLWENYLISERRKTLLNMPFPPLCHFWRTHTQQEIDYIEESPEGLFAYEIKWSSAKHRTMPKVFHEAYPTATFRIVNQTNYESFIG